MQNTNSPKRSVRLNNKRLARLDTKKDANTDIPSVHADFNNDSEKRIKKQKNYKNNLK